MTLVAREYVDALGTRRAAPPETVAQFERLVDAQAHPVTPPVRTVREGEPVTLDVTLPQISWPETLRWTLVREDGSTERGELALRDAPVVATEPGDVTFDTRRVTIPATVPLGIHRIDFTVAAFADATAHVTVVPEHAYPPSGRTWGIALQLYTLRSERNDGVGDFADLRAVCALLGERGASYVGINPLHASFRGDPDAASPYSASSRRWLNWLCIAVDEVPEARDPSVAALLADPARAQRQARLRAAGDVDYAGVAAMKDEALRACFAVLERDETRRYAFLAWCVERGEALRRFATFDVLAARFGRSLAAWPPPYHSPDAPDVALFAAAESDEVQFAMYLQWLAAEQLAAVARDAAKHGVRLYRDLAVGVDANAADVWADAGTYVPGVSVGAPPDVLNTLGQDWGLPPPHPGELGRDGYLGLLALLQANCRDAGALRIDHAFSLARLYWIPRGAGARTGTYVAYPLDDLRGIVALASVRERCVVIGEDLGTVPEGFRDQMEATGILSYRILLFERTLDGAFIPPEAYPALALAASGTHDLATIPAWLHGEDLGLRDRLGFLETPLDAEYAARERDRDALLDALIAHGDLDPAQCDDEIAVVIAANRYLAAAPCAIVMAQLDDILGERMPVNVPGTSHQYPNWRRKLGTDVDSLASDERLRRLCTTLAQMRPRVP
ncbi:4-alpha-glucanotransferase [Vulcanimicrobium alpinum]|uniref:4-alpha-glucanotransferase n=1 Tax=Vulcanimicrobium alpinum TaxID=3016050 RepID=A0AAN1XU89_UNVUL|nr:4-alpha-glucanotransferase [Vulcanimicrobium alpinum]BDE05185.1 4-alpha-glucanotransferase [Vulcanimicrobium alpinum]